MRPDGMISLRDSEFNPSGLSYSVRFGDSEFNPSGLLFMKGLVSGSVRPATTTGLPASTPGAGPLERKRRPNFKLPMALAHLLNLLNGLGQDMRTQQAGVGIKPLVHVHEHSQ